MSTLRNAGPGSLRPKMHESIDRLRDEDLEPLHQLLVEIESRALFDQMREEAREDWEAGRLLADKVRAAILEHRRKHPYR